MKNKNILLIVGIIILVLVIISVVYFSFQKNGKGCAKLGENFSVVYKDKYPERCCGKLTGVYPGQTSDFISIADNCYDNGNAGGSAVGYCINCGDDICEDNEGVCNCPADCKGKNKSNFVSIKEFCQSNAWKQSYSRLCEIYKSLAICKLCI